jgi:hypothetical protein
MNNIIMLKITTNGSAQPLSATKLIASVTISCPPSNVYQAFLKVGTSGTEVPWVPGEWHEFKSIDLNMVYVRGFSPDVITVIGGTW